MATKLHRPKPTSKKGAVGKGPQYNKGGKVGSKK